MFGKGRTSLTWRRQTALWRRRVRAHSLVQILLLLAFWQLGEVIVHLAGLPIPGAIAGLFLVLALLVSNCVSPHSLRRGSKWFLAELLLFLLPTVPSLRDHPEFFGLLGLKILTAIFLGTTIVMVVTALVIEFCHRWLIERTLTLPRARRHRIFHQRANPEIFPLSAIRNGGVGRGEVVLVFRPARQIGYSIKMPPAHRIESHSHV